MTISDALIRAVYRKDHSAIRSIVAAGEDMNATDEDGRTPLMHAILAEDADTKTVGLLVELGADVNVHDGGQNWTSLHFAARDQQADIVLALIESGANVEPIDCFGNTPLWRCVMECQVDPAVVKILLEHGADPTRKNHHGASPLDIAVNTGDEELKTLLTKGFRYGRGPAR